MYKDTTKKSNTKSGNQYARSKPSQSPTFYKKRNLVDSLPRVMTWNTSNVVVVVVEEEEEDAQKRAKRNPRASQQAAC
jgi:hypothetical protein